jgi:hypothetical protein
MKSYVCVGVCPSFMFNKNGRINPVHFFQSVPTLHVCLFWLEIFYGCEICVHGNYWTTKFMGPTSLCSLYFVTKTMHLIQYLFRENLTKNCMPIFEGLRVKVEMLTVNLFKS